MVLFAAGAVVGMFIGFTAMAILVVAGDADRNEAS